MPHLIGKGEVKLYNERSLWKREKQATSISSYLEVFEGIRHFDNLKCQSFCGKCIETYMKFAVWFFRTVEQKPLWTLTKCTNQNFNNKLVIHPCYYKLVGSGDCLCSFDTKEWVNECFRLITKSFFFFRQGTKGNKTGP